MLTADDKETPIHKHIATSVLVPFGEAIDVATESMRRIGRTPTLRAIANCHEAARNLAVHVGRAFAGDPASVAAMADLLATTIAELHISHLTAKQAELLGCLLADGPCFLRGESVRVAQALERAGHVRITDNGHMAKDRRGRTDGERWYVELVS